MLCILSRDQARHWVPGSLQDVCHLGYYFGPQLPFRLGDFLSGDNQSMFIRFPVFVWVDSSIM